MDGEQGDGLKTWTAEMFPRNSDCGSYRAEKPLRGNPSVILKRIPEERTKACEAVDLEDDDNNLLFGVSLIE